MSRLNIFMVLLDRCALRCRCSFGSGNDQDRTVQSMTGSFDPDQQTVMQARGSTCGGMVTRSPARRSDLAQDDASLPDIGKRLAQELIVNDKVALMLGGITPSALTIAPLTVEAKITMIVAVSGASITVERSPYMVRTSFTNGQSSSVMAEWATKNGAKKIVTLVNDWTPGLEAEKAFTDVAVKGGAEIVAALGCRWQIRILRHSCSVPAISSLTRCLSLCQISRQGRL